MSSRGDQDDNIITSFESFLPILDKINTHAKKRLVAVIGNFHRFVTKTGYCSKKTANTESEIPTIVLRVSDSPRIEEATRATKTTPPALASGNTTKPA